MRYAAPRSKIAARSGAARRRPAPRLALVASLALALAIPAGPAAAQGGEERPASAEPPELRGAQVAPGAQLAQGPGMVLGVEDCVALATRTSPRMAQAEASVHEYEARLREVESSFYPKLTGTAFAAPAYTVRGSGFDRTPEIRWRSIRDWGPYTNLEMMLAQPIYSFGRGAAAKEAASARADVERARVREAGAAVALETRRLYYTRLYALSMLPALAQAKEMVDQALERAEQMYAGGGGEVTQIDLAKLTYARAEVSRLMAQAHAGEQVALAALKHTMGLLHGRVLRQADTQLRAPEQLEVAPLPDLLQRASAARPEWLQLAHGRRAALKWEEAERLAVWPTLVLVGVFNAAWTPTHDRDSNNWHYDVYNRLVGGAALAVKFNLDPALARARASLAHASGEQVEALGRFAATGIPLQVRRAHEDLAAAQTAVPASAEGMAATRRWLRAAASAYSSGTGEARDMLEGMAAYLQARQRWLEAVQAYHVGQAELTHAIGAPR